MQGPWVQSLIREDSTCQLKAKYSILSHPNNLPSSCSYRVSWLDCTTRQTQSESVFNQVLRAFPCSSVGKESAYNAGDLGLIPGSGRSPEEGKGYPLQYSWASLVAQLVKNLPAMQETWVRSLGWEDPLEKGKATHSSILAWRIPWGHKESGTTE